MAVQRIADEEVTTRRRRYHGREAYIVCDETTGEIFTTGGEVPGDKPGVNHRVGTRPERTLFVGTNVEIAAKRAELDTQFAPIKAQREAARKAAADAAKATRRQ